MILRKSILWLAFAAIAVAVLSFRLQLSFDISAFFPSQQTLSHNVLLHQFQNGPGSRLLVIGLNGANKADLEEASDQLRELLAEHSAFNNVMNGEAADDLAIPEPVASYYPLMRDIDFEKDALQQMTRQRLQDLAFAGGPFLTELIGNDPSLSTLDILKRLAPVNLNAGMWFAKDGSAVLMAETHSSAVEIAEQEEAVAAIRQAFSELPELSDLTLEITGAGAFGVELQSAIRAETQKRTLLASTALLIVLFAFYRRVRFLVLASVPIGMGFLAGLTVVSLVFETVHGITLAFGFTLMGVAIDYPLHLFSHSAGTTGIKAISRIWPTMRLGALSTIIAYLALSFSGSEGLAQLGIFTAAGIAVALLVTKTWVPQLINGEDSADSKGNAVAPELRFLPGILGLLLALGAAQFLKEEPLWDDRLTSLSPVPQERIQTDTVLRQAAGTADMRYQLFLHDTTLERLLSRNERLDLLLEDAKAQGLIRNWQSLTQLLPSAVEQKRRQQAIPNADDLKQRLEQALKGSPYHPGAFDGFLTIASNAKSAPLLDIHAFEGTPLQSWRDSHLVQIADHWVSLVSLQSPNPEGLRRLLSDYDDTIEVLDLTTESAALMSDYRSSALLTVAIAALIVVFLLWYQLRVAAQVLWIVLSISAGLAITIVAVSAVHGQLTVIHLVALLLVIGLGLDYALFLSRSESATDSLATRQAVLACSVSTTVAFGILAGSSIPVLKFLGLTVAIGSISNYLLAQAGSLRTKP